MLETYITEAEVFSQRHSTRKLSVFKTYVKHYVLRKYVKLFYFAQVNDRLIYLLAGAPTMLLIIFIL